MRSLTSENKTAKFLLFCLTTFGNYWIWHLFQQNLFLGFTMVLVAALLLIVQLSRVFSVRLSVFSTAIILLLIVIIFRATPITILSDLSIYYINERRQYFSVPIIGKLLENKLTTAVEIWERNLFETLDLNAYFFAGHPRERLGGIDYPKFPFLLMPIFLTGLYSLVKKRCWGLLIHFAVIVVGLSFFTEAATWIFLFFPWFITVNYFGYMELLGQLCLYEKD